MSEAVTYALYRFFDSGGRLLYVGMTKDPERRFKQHGDSKSWWTEVARIEMEHFGTLEALREAERTAIKSEHPAHNIRMNGDGAAYAPRPTSRCGLSVGSAYALGLDDGDCPVGLVVSLDDEGVTLDLYSWIGQIFDGPDTWVPYRSIRRWVRAEKHDREWWAGVGVYGFTDGMFAMDDLARFQDKWLAVPDD